MRPQDFDPSRAAFQALSARHDAGPCGTMVTDSGIPGPTVVPKLGAFARHVLGFRFDEWPEPPDSATLAEAWRPILEPRVEIFGSERCLFESNFPVDKAMTSYAVLWNACKRMVAACSADERDAMFHRTAARAYRIGNAA